MTRLRPPAPFEGGRSNYDDVAPRYDAAMRPLERWFLKCWREKAFDELPKTGRILEIGAGTGVNFAHYPSETAGIATEPSGEMIKVASGKSRPETIQLVQSCAERLPFVNDSFDAAIATLVFCSVESTSQAFAELRRVVKNGGRVVLLEHVRPGGVLGPIFDLLNVFTARLGDRFNRRTVSEAAASGLQLERVEKRMFGILNLILCRV